jgi:sodium-dependent dicarboxylate transporter 2/3/5
MSYNEWCALIAFGITISLWLLPALFKSSVQSTPQLSVLFATHNAAICGVITLFLLRLLGRAENRLSWKEASEFDWGIILLFGGGLCLGEILTTAKLPQYIFALCGVDLLTTGTQSLGLSLVALFLVLTIMLSEFCSNTVAAAVLVPTVLEIAPNNILMAVTIGLAAGFGFMLPISTPPNALVFGTGRIPLREMIVTGVLLDVAGFGALILYFYLMNSWP